MAPGNDRMTLDGFDLVNISISEHSKLIDFAKTNDIVWTFIGSDDALVAGIVDDFNAAVLKVFGLTKSAAELEWSKYFARKIMVKYDVPIQISRKTRPTSRKKAIQSSSKKMAWLGLR